MYIVNNNKLNVFLLDSLLKVEKDLVIVFNVFAKVHDNILSDGLLSHCRLVLNQKVLFHFIETLFIQVLASNYKEGLALKSTLLNGKN